MKSRKGAALMLAGVLLLTASLLLTAVNRSEEQRAERQAVKVAGILEKQVIPDIPPGDGPVAEAVMQSAEIDGHDYIGVLEIPALGVSLPIIKDWNQNNDLLKLAPCRYGGSFLNGSMVVAGHNYKKHFGGLSRLESGDSVVFTDVGGTVYRYAVIGTEILDGKATEEMVSGDWDLTLFTCTYDGRRRVTVRCEENA